jgi:predicted nucleic acid-binding protein
MRRTADVLANVEHAASVFTAVTLSRAEYLWVLRHAAAVGVRSGQLYDALILKAAEHVNAAAVYTWNVAHFTRVAWPAMAGRIRTP